MRVPLPLVRAAVLAGSRPLGRPVPVPVQRAWLETAARLTRVPRGTVVEQVVVGGRPAERVTATDADGTGSPGRSSTVLLLHGGAFVTCSPRTHRGLAAHLARAAAAPVVVLAYRRAPEHPWPAAVDDAEAALDQLLGEGPVHLVGDSAGGGLALLLLTRRRDAGRRLPGAVGLVSPVADLTGATADAYRGRDPVLRRSWVRDGCAAFTGSSDAAALSPLRLPLHDLPPVLVQVSEHERLRPEGEQLVAAIAAAGTRAELEMLPGLWHDVHLQADLVPAAAVAVARLGQWLRARA